MTVILHHGDAVQWAREYDGELFHALLCDAPYEMAFMGKSWDGSGVAFDPETWRAFARVLHPGAFLFVFAGTINDDLISVAMREAGLRKFHKVMGWTFGSGFPKASRIDTQIDKAAGAEREVVGRHIQSKQERKPGNSYQGSVDASLAWQHDLTAPATPLAQTWAGHRYGLQALKPAIETVLIFQKPYEGRPVDCITQTGAGALWIDGARIPIDAEADASQLRTMKRNRRETADGWGMSTVHGDEPQVVSSQGRWASNFYLSDEAARRLDEQSGDVRGAVSNGRRGVQGVYKDSIGAAEQTPGYNDSGGASRFFLRVSEQIDAADPVRYVAKASRRERDAGLEGMPEHRGNQNLINSKVIVRGHPENGKPTPSENKEPLLVRNPHPCLKPLALTRYLATLLLPPAEYAPRRIFIPFAGTMSEGIGAMQAGWEHVEGVELTEEYLPIARARVEYWQERQRLEAEQAQMELPL